MTFVEPKDGGKGVWIRLNGAIKLAILPHSLKQGGAIDGVPGSHCWGGP